MNKRYKGRIIGMCVDIFKLVVTKRWLQVNHLQHINKNNKQMRYI
ncbi:hypothetical protein [Candidatus Hodgkinia cicadicola]